MVGLEFSKLFNGLSDEEIVALKSIAQTVVFRRGQFVFREKDTGDGLYVIGEGRVHISATVGEGETKVLSRLGPGDFFGEMAVVDNEPRSASATAEEDATLFFIPRDAMLRMLESLPRLSVGLVRSFSLRMRDFNRHYLQEVLQAERLTLVGRFARSIVHDFKNPLAIIGLAADLGAMENAPAQTRMIAQQRIRKQVDRLSNMINELLEFTRGSQASTVLAHAPFSLFIDQLVEDMQPDLAAKSVELVCENPIPTTSLLLDPRRLSHVFYNLFHNAVDAMPNGGKIILRFQETAREMIVEIEDTGPGISPEIADRLFEPFATFGKSHGTGLGLSIVKRIIHDHSGSIRSRSEPGRGAIFVIALPLQGPE
jgi:signal transduction histidine kinase